jgi:hypothetical protein
MSKAKKALVVFLAGAALAVSVPPAFAGAPGPGDPQCLGANGNGNPHCPPGK